MAACRMHGWVDKATQRVNNHSKRFAVEEEKEIRR